MKLHHVLTAATIGLLSVGAGASAHADDSEQMIDSSPDTLVVGEDENTTAAARWTLCEGLVSCWALEFTCGANGGYYSEFNDPDARDGNHTHGICSTG